VRREGAKAASKQWSLGIQRSILESAEALIILVVLHAGGTNFVSMTDSRCKRAMIRQSSKALGHIANFRAGVSVLSPRARKEGAFSYLIAKSDYFLFLLWPIVGNPISESLSNHRSMNRAAAIGKRSNAPSPTTRHKVSRYPNPSRRHYRHSGHDYDYKCCIGRLFSELRTSMPDTISELIECYRSDPHSSFAKLGYSVKIKHGRLLARIVREHGQVSLLRLRNRDLIVWHQAWLGNGKIAMAHALMTRLRVVFRFGATILEDRECSRLVNALADMRFEKPSLRDQPISSDQAKAIRVIAHTGFGWHSISLAQAFQFELGLNQKAVIGEWVTISNTSLSDVQREKDRGVENWISGLRWSDLDDDFVLRPAAGKTTRQKEFNLREKRMIMEELALLSKTPIAKLTCSQLPRSGPIILNEINALPFSTAEFRRKWRLVANRAGIPKNITNKDSNKLANAGKQ
jgi:hypothetical protein